MCSSDLTAQERRIGAIEIKPQAQHGFVDQVQNDLRRTVWQSGCKSWYLNEQGRNTSLWPGFTFTYRLKTRRFKLGDYATARRTANPAPHPKSHA